MQRVYFQNEFWAVNFILERGGRIIFTEHDYLVIDAPEGVFKSLRENYRELQKEVEEEALENRKKQLVESRRLQDLVEKIF